MAKIAIAHIFMADIGMVEEKEEVISMYKFAQFEGAYISIFT